jgi:hypothetical protein
VKVASVQKATPVGAVVKGFRGSGTADDPLLVESEGPFMRLQQPEVGQQGYHFLQTVDLDFSEIQNPWLIVKFKGHYHGGGYDIVGSNATVRNIFSEVDASVIQCWSLHNIRLGSSIRKSEINDCEVTLKDFKFSVESGCSGIALGLNGSNVKNCFVKFSNIKGIKRKSSTTPSLSFALAYMAGTEKTESSFAFGIASFGSGLIESCFVGEFDVKGMDAESVSRIAGSSERKTIKFSNNFCLEKLGDSENSAGPNGQTIPNPNLV